VPWPPAPDCQWMIFLLDVGVELGEGLDGGVGDDCGVDDAGEFGATKADGTTMASKARKHGRDM